MPTASKETFDIVLKVLANEVEIANDEVGDSWIDLHEAKASGDPDGIDSAENDLTLARNYYDTVLMAINEMKAFARLSGFHEEE